MEEPVNTTPPSASIAANFEESPSQLSSSSSRSWRGLLSVLLLGGSVMAVVTYAVLIPGMRALAQCPQQPMYPAIIVLAGLGVLGALALPLPMVNALSNFVRAVKGK